MVPVYMSLSDKVFFLLRNKVRKRCWAKGADEIG